MRTYREQTQIIRNRYELHRNAHKKRKNIVYSSLTAAVCLIVITAFIFPFSDYRYTNNLTAVSEDDVSEGFNNSGTEYAADEAYISNEDSVQSAFFNNLDNTATNAMRRYFDPDKTYEKKLNDGEAFEYLGKDVLPSYMPKELIYRGETNPDYRHTLIYNNDGTICFDQFYFFYAENFDDYNPMTKKLEISVSKLGSAQGDCILVWSDDMKVSKIKDLDIYFGERSMGYGPYTVVDNGPNIPTGYYDLFVAEFTYEGVNYQVISDNFTKEEFVHVITSMIEQK